jgi:predicted kinase
LEPIVHLVCGPVGSGKTTYSRRLAAENGAVVFSIDEWMQNLFVGDLPAEAGMAKIDFAWFSERVDRCEKQIWVVAEQLLKQGTTVILDLGFIRKNRREKARNTASSLGFASQMHIVHADLETRRARVSVRNSNKGETYALTVTPAMFAFAEKMYEAPDDDESVLAIQFCS